MCTYSVATVSCLTDASTALTHSFLSCDTPVCVTPGVTASRNLHWQPPNPISHISIYCRVRTPRPLSSLFLSLFLARARSIPVPLQSNPPASMRFAIVIVSSCLMALAAGQPLDQNTMLSLHTAARSALGLSPATWSAALEASATAAINVCPTGHTTGAGTIENLAWGWPTYTTTQAFDDWLDEKAHYTLATQTCAPGQVCDHYANIVSAALSQPG